MNNKMLNLVRLEAEGLELDFAVLFVHRILVEIHVARNIKVYPKPAHVHGGSQGCLRSRSGSRTLYHAVGP